MITAAEGKLIQKHSGRAAHTSPLLGHLIKNCKAVSNMFMHLCTISIPYKFKHSFARIYSVKLSSFLFPLVLVDGSTFTARSNINCSDENLEVLCSIVPFHRHLLGFLASVVSCSSHPPCISFIFRSFDFSCLHTMLLFSYIRKLNTVLAY